LLASVRKEVGLLGGERTVGLFGMASLSPWGNLVQFTQNLEFSQKPKYNASVHLPPSAVKRGQSKRLKSAWTGPVKRLVINPVGIYFGIGSWERLLKNSETNEYSSGSCLGNEKDNK
jgi:hypothetical protein